MRSNRKKVYCNSTNSIIYKNCFYYITEILLFQKILCLIYICFASWFFVAFIEINDRYWKHNIIDLAWVDEINVT